MQQFHRDRLNEFTSKKRFNSEQSAKAFELYEAILAEKKGSKFYKKAIRQGWYDIEGVKVTHLRQIKTLLRKIATEEIQGVKYEISPEFNIFKESFIWPNEGQATERRKSPKKPEDKPPIELRFNSQGNSDIKHYPAQVPELNNESFAHGFMIPGSAEFKSSVFPTTQDSRDSVEIKRTDPFSDNMSVPFGYLAVEGSYQEHANHSTYRIVEQSKNPHDFFYKFLEPEFEQIQRDNRFVQNYKDLIMFLISGCERGFPTLDPLIENLQYFIGAQWAKAFLTDYGRPPIINGDYVRTKDKKYSNENLDHLNDSPSKIIEHGLTKGYGNCLSFSYAICYLLNQIGIRSVVMLADATFKGSSFSTPGHAWIEIFHNGEMIKFDPTHYLKNPEQEILELPFNKDLFAFCESHIALLPQYNREEFLKFKIESIIEEVPILEDITKPPKNPEDIIKTSMSREDVEILIDVYHEKHIKKLLEWQLFQTFYDIEGKQKAKNKFLFGLFDELDASSESQQEVINEISTKTIDVSSFLGIFSWLDHICFYLNDEERENFNFTIIIKHIFKSKDFDLLINQIKFQVPMLYKLIIEVFKYISFTNKGLIFKERQRVKPSVNPYDIQAENYYSSIPVNAEIIDGIEQFIYTNCVNSIQTNVFGITQRKDVNTLDECYDEGYGEYSGQTEVTPIRHQILEEALKKFKQRHIDFTDYELRGYQDGDSAQNIVHLKSRFPDLLILKDYKLTPQIKSKGIILSANFKGIDGSYIYDLPQGSLQAIQKILKTCMESKVDLIIPSMYIVSPSLRDKNPSEEENVNLIEVKFSTGKKYNLRQIALKIYEVLKSNNHGTLTYADPRLRSMHKIIIQNDERIVELDKRFYRDPKVIAVI